MREEKEHKHDQTLNKKTDRIKTEMTNETSEQ